MNVKQKAFKKLKQVYKILRGNKIHCTEFCLLGYVDRCPKGQFAINKKDIEKVMQIFPFIHRCITNQYEHRAIMYIDYNDLITIK